MCRGGEFLRHAVIVGHEPEDVPGYSQTFHDSNGQLSSVTEAGFHVAIIILGKDPMVLRVDFEDNPMLTTEDPEFVLEPTEIRIVSSQETRCAREYLEMVCDFECWQVDHDNDRVASFIGDVETIAADGDAFEGGIAIRTEKAFYRGPINVQALNISCERVTPQDPPVRFFTNIKTSLCILGYPFAIIVPIFFAGILLQLRGSEKIGKRCEVRGIGSGFEFDGIERWAAVAVREQGAIGEEQEA